MTGPSQHPVLPLAPPSLPPPAAAHLSHEIRKVGLAGVSHKAGAATFEPPVIWEIIWVEQQAVAVASDVTHLCAVVKVRHLAATAEGHTHTQKGSHADSRSAHCVVKIECCLSLSTG